jgi:AcrR family transcriptional regulator
MELFASRNIPTIKMSDVATYIGVSRGTLYRNVASTPPLYEQLAQFHAEDLKEMSALACAAERTCASRYAQFILDLMRRAEHEPSWCKYILRYSVVDPLVYQGIDHAIEHVLSSHSREDGPRLTIERRDAVFDVFAGMQAIRFGDNDWREAGLKCIRKSINATTLPAQDIEALLKKHP